MRNTLKLAAILSAAFALTMAAAPTGTALASTKAVRPLPAALANYSVAKSFGASELYTWRFPQNEPGGAWCNPDHVKLASGVVSVNTNGNKGDCGVIQSPHEYPTTSGYVYEAHVYFPAIPNTTNLADWTAYWMYGDNWPVDGEVDAVETTFGTNFVTYHYGQNNSSVSTCNRNNGCDANAGPLTPKSSNIKAGWHTVDIAYGWKRIEIFYDGKAYVSIGGNYVTMKPAWIAFSAGSDPSMNRTGIPGSLKVDSLKIFRSN